MAKRTTDPGRLKSIRFGPDSIRVKFDEAPIDALARRFVDVLHRDRVPYAIVSGYPAILLGRSRESEDVDILISKISLALFRKMHTHVTKDLECISPGDAGQLYADYLDAGEESTSVRYSERGRLIPNVELKFAHTSFHRNSIKRRIPVTANGKTLYIGPLETQIAYKIWLGTPKDLEDAQWIYHVAREHLHEAEIWETAAKLRIGREEARRALRVLK